MTDSPALARHKRQRNIIAASVVGIVGLSLGMSFAAVPLYRKFCQATGFGGTTQVAEGPAGTLGRRSLNVRFDANVAPGLPWRFEPETPAVTVRTGQTATVYFRVTNLSDQSTVADARYNVSPDVAGGYFDKISCFCFTQQKLDPHETLDMPVVFFLNPALEDEESMRAVDTLVLSYTFFAPPGGNRPVAAVTPDGESTKPKL